MRQGSENKLNANIQILELTIVLDCARCNTSCDLVQVLTPSIDSLEVRHGLLCQPLDTLSQWRIDAMYPKSSPLCSADMKHLKE